MKDKLNKTFVASPILTNLSIPFILDKLTSQVKNSKLDALTTLQLMFIEYPIERIREFADGIWNHLQHEVYN